MRSSLTLTNNKALKTLNYCWCGKIETSYVMAAATAYGWGRGCRPYIMAAARIEGAGQGSFPRKHKETVFLLNSCLIRLIHHLSIYREAYLTPKQVILFFFSNRAGEMRVISLRRKKEVPPERLYTPWGEEWITTQTCTL
jgi:hypothetical protein